MAPQTVLANINSIGTPEKPVAVIRAKIIIADNISAKQPLYSPGAPVTETLYGIVIDETTDEVSFKGKIVAQDNIKMGANFINGTGVNNAGIHFPGGGLNPRVTGNLTVTGVIDAGSNIKTNGNYMSFDGTNKGAQPKSNGNVDFTDSIFVTNAVQAQGLIYSQTLLTSDGPTRGNILQFTDGVSEPAAIAGVVQLFTDTSGNTKIKYGDGTVKPLATNP